jgi:hypothetical protein
MTRCLLLCPLLLFSCSSGTDSASISDPLDETGIDDETPSSAYFQPHALSVGYTGGWDEHYDALTDWAYKGEGYDGYIRLSLVTEEYLRLAPDDPAREEEYCEIRALYHSAPAQLNARSLDEDTDAVLRAAFDGHIEIYGFIGTQCYNFDPAVWINGDPRAAFDGMRLGLGLGTLTPFLADGWAPETVMAYGNYMLATYVAINRPDAKGGAEFVAEDWTTALLWQWDVASGEVLTNDEGVLMGQDISDPVLSGWLSCYPYWFQTLDELDLELLQDGVELVKDK